MRPESLGRYELIRHLASGGMASIYLARATGPGGFARHVVLKTLPAKRRDDDAFVAMFLDEARLIATLHHQHIAQVFEVGRGDDGTYFLAMEYVHGETVRHLLEIAINRGVKLPLELGLSIVCAAAAGLHHAHERCGIDGTPLGIVHRDVSPSNLILGFDGSIKLIDFGIAKATLRTTHTATGCIKGKAGYMAPEQARGYAVDRRSDVFALGVLAYELTTQARAFHGDSQFETIRRTLHGEVALPSRVVAGYPVALERVIMTALEVDPDDRFQDAAAMQRALEEVARELDLTLGDGPVIRALEQLFRARPEPWLASATTSIDDDPTPVLADSPPRIVASRTPTRVRLARGTDARESHGAAVVLTQPIDPMDLTTRPFEKELPLPDVVVASESMAPIPRAPSATRARVPTPAPRQPSPWTALLDVPIADPRQSRALRTWPPFTTPPPITIARRPPEVAATGRRRHVIWIGAVVVGLGLVLAAIAWFSSDAPIPPVTMAQPPPSLPPATSPPPAIVIPTIPPPPGPGERVAAPDTVMLHVTTAPVGATVVLDGVRLGTTPFMAPVAAKPGKAWLKVRMRKHVAVKTRVSLDQDVRWDVRLQPLAH